MFKFTQNCHNYIQEKVLSTPERDNMNDSTFGISSLRKFPLNDAAHVRSAISYFHYAPEKHRKELAGKIRSRAAKFGVEVNSDMISKY